MSLLSVITTLLLSIPAIKAAPAANTPYVCSPDGLRFPNIAGLQFLSRTAVPVFDYTASGRGNVGFYASTPTITASFCNATFTYTHPGEGDVVTVTVALPLQGNWNGRFVAAGGGGFVTGSFASQFGALREGYSSASTDGGHSSTAPRPTWALIANGILNWPLIQNFAYRSEGEMIQIGKRVTRDYYGTPARYSYWSGCSTGGRQGLAIAQRYPNLLDGIFAAAPAVYNTKLVPAQYWAQQVMNILGAYPQACEFDAIVAAGIAACDSLDGVTDSVVANPRACNFRASTMVGRTIICPATGLNVTISAAAATVAEATWQGPRTQNGTFLWYGQTKSTPLTTLAGTRCNAQGANCTGAPVSFPPDYFDFFVKKDPNFNETAMSYAQYEDIFRASVQEFSILDTSDPDLNQFRKSGGKMITYHGLDDNVIVPDGSVQYYNAVSALVPNIRNFYRYFEAPGIRHCSGGNGFFPNSTFDALVNWVENKVAPERLVGSTLFRADGVVRTQPLCVYPLVARYVSGDAAVESSYACAPSFA